MVEKALFEADMSDSETYRVSREILPKIQELESKQGGDWISVEERLPEKWQDVLVLTWHFHYDAWLSSSSNWIINNTFHTEEAYANGVTHWKPLPLPPTK